MEQRSNAAIFPNRVVLDKIYIEEKGGILNALTYASAQYIYKVLEKYGREKIKRFDEFKTKKLRRTIIHKNAHLDEYFAELLFRAILPPHLKDIEVSEHVLMSKEDDTFAKISWPNGVVFGIHAEETGGAKALAFFDEHLSDGTRIKPSCSQLVAEEFLGNNIPRSLQKVLDEVNYSDSHAGAHQYNIKNLFFAMHDILFVIGRNEIDNAPVTKYLTENWKRAIVGASLTAMVYVYENDLLNERLNDQVKFSIEKITKKSIDYFIEKTLLANQSEVFDGVSKKLLFNFRNGNHDTIDRAVWKNENGQTIGQQILISHFICYALHKCWGDNIANFIMMHIWQILFQQQVSYQEVKEEIIAITEAQKKGNTKFGYIEKTLLANLSFNPEQNEKDKRKRTLKSDSPLWIYEVSVTNPNFPNVATVLKSIINDDYTQKGNNGFGLFILHDKTINSKIINNGQTIPANIWKKISDKIIETEGDCWFQLKSAEGNYADFILNRTKAHQDQLPSDIVDINFIMETIQDL